MGNEMPGNWTYNWKPFVADLPNSGVCVLLFENADGFGWIKLKHYSEKNVTRYYQIDSNCKLTSNPPAEWKKLQAHRIKTGDRLSLEWSISAVQKHNSEQRLSLEIRLN